MDLYLSHTYSNIRYIGSTTLESFIIPRADESVKIFQREQRLTDSKNIGTRLPLTLKVNYTTDRMTLVNTVGYVFNTAPTQSRSGSLNLSSDPTAAFNYETSTPSHSNSLVWNSSLYMALGRGWTGGLDNFLSHTHRDEYSRYTSDYVDTDIINNARENAYNYSSNLTLRKQFGQSHSMNINATGGVDYSRVDYAGSSPFKERFASPFFSVACGYNYNSEKISLGASGGIQWQQFRGETERLPPLSVSVIPGENQTEPVPGRFPLNTTIHSCGFTIQSRAAALICALATRSVMAKRLTGVMRSPGSQAHHPQF